MNNAQWHCPPVWRSRDYSIWRQVNWVSFVNCCLLWKILHSEVLLFSWKKLHRTAGPVWSLVYCPGTNMTGLFLCFKNLSPAWSIIIENWLLFWFLPMHRCVLALYTLYFPESCENIISEILLGWDSNPQPFAYLEQCLAKQTTEIAWYIV